MVKPDGTATTFNSSSGSTQTFGFETSNFEPGDYTIRACFNQGCLPSPTATAQFFVNSSQSFVPKTNNFTVFSRNLTVGSIGDDVKQLQALLVKEVGYSANLITGYFGRITQDAVKRLQEKYGVRPVSGYFGEITRKALNAAIFNW